MRLVRYASATGARRGAVVGADVHEVIGGPAGPVEVGARVGALEDVLLLAPTVPRTIVCAGANYASQLREKGLEAPARPRFFLKGANAVVGPAAEVLRPRELRRLEYEGELAVVIGRTAHRVQPDAWRDHVLGYTCANDITADDWRSDGQWVRAKSSDTFCPVGPWVETDLADPSRLRLRTVVNGEVVQDGSTGEMLFDIGALLAYITRWVSLQPGDLLLTGSPGGVGPLVPGDVVTVDIEGIGALTNAVAAAP